MHEMNKKIYYHDTDCGGVVYYANYLKYLEEGRTEYLNAKGVDIKQLSEQDIVFVVRRVEVDYKFPARYGDNLLILSELSNIKRATIEFAQDIVIDTNLLIRAKIELVCVNYSFSPKRIPEEIIKCLKK